MKPDPYLLVAACTVLGADPSRLVFVGDSVSDVTAGHACGMPVIGIAKHAQRAADLADAGADAGRVEVRPFSLINPSGPITQKVAVSKEIAPSRRGDFTAGHLQRAVIDSLDC